MTHQHDNDRGHDHEHGHGHVHDHLHDHPFAGRGMRGGRGRWGGGRGGWGGGRRMPRGAIRSAILAALRDEPANGYEVMRRLEEMSGGLWRPSPGSVYPHLQMLEDEGLVQSTTTDASKAFELTEAGAESAAAANAERAGREPWEQDDTSDDRLRAL